jgi:hypothetical protein
MNDGRIIMAAKEFMIEYLSDGQIKQPGNFDEDILGQPMIVGATQIVMGVQPSWNRTIFCTALGELVDEGKVKAWEDEKGWYYQISESVAKPAVREFPNIQTSKDV